MIRFETGVLIDRPVRAVFALLADPLNLPRWQDTVREIRPKSGGARGKGSTYTVVGEMLGRRIERTMEVAEFEFDSRFAYRMTSGPIKVQGDFSFSPAGSGTRFSLSAQGEPGGVFKRAEGFMTKHMRGQMEANLARLKSVLEAGA
jgi:uncharacterized protein YndB with AHSA1/START domain